MRVGIILIALIALMLLAVMPSAHGDQKSVLIVNFDYQVDTGAQDSLQRVLYYATTEGDPVVIVMNTPGGYLSSAFNIVNYTINAEKSITVTTYVPPGSMAASAGSYIALASDYVFMGNASIIGPSEPYVIGGTELEQEHVTNASLALMESLAQVHGWNESAVYLMVEKNVAYTAQNASKIGLITGMSDNLTGVLKKLGYLGLPVTEFTENQIEQLESFLSNSTIADLLILIGIIAIVLDIFHGSVLLSVAGVITLALGIWGVTLINFQPIAIFFIVLGAALIFLEIKLGHGFALAGGVGLIIVGGLIMLLGVTYSSSNPALNGESYAIIALEATVIPIGSLYLIALRRSVMKRPPRLGPQTVIGKRGRAVTDIAAGGKGVVLVQAEEWTAISQDEIKKNDEIEVIDVKEAILYVKKVS
ncbi:MAG: NfeD family protein [Thermoplasmatales archaeon]